jgi:hypothetical protein
MGVVAGGGVPVRAVVPHPWIKNKAPRAAQCNITTTVINKADVFITPPV